MYDKVASCSVKCAADPPGCARGFWDVDVLKHIMAATSVITLPEREVTLRQMGFPCLNGSTIKKWYVGARIAEEGTFPQIDLLVNNTVFHTSSLTYLNATPYLNVYEYEPSPPVMVIPTSYITLRNGDISSSQVYYYRYGLRDFGDQPLISVDAGQNCLYLLHVLSELCYVLYRLHCKYLF